MTRIYLAGPIFNCTYEEIHGWRDQLIKRYPGIRFLDPSSWTTEGNIVKTDKENILSSNYVLANCFKYSPGTCMEIIYAWENNIPVITVTSEKEVSPWITYHSYIVLPTIDEAMKFIDEE